MHSTNYTDTLILPSEDCRAVRAAVPGTEGSIARMQYDRMAAAPYTLTSDDLIIAVQGARKDIDDDDLPGFRAEFFSKGQACLRASPLVKSFGWAIHHDASARVALIDPDGADCARLTADPAISTLRGMRNARR